MNCQRVRTLLSSYLDEMLPARDAGAVAGHLTRCADCRGALSALESALGALDRVRPASPPIDLWERFQERLEAVPSDDRRPRPLAPLTAPADEGRRRKVSPLAGSGGRWATVGAPALAGLLLAVIIGGIGYRIGVDGGGSGASVLAEAVRDPAAGSSSRGVAADARQAHQSAILRARALPRIAAPEKQIGPLEPPALPRVASRETVPSAAPGNRRGQAREDLTFQPPALPEARSDREAIASAGPSGSPGTLQASKRGADPERSEPDAVGEPQDAVKTTALYASAPVARVLQTSIEDVARQQVSEEVARLAEALTRAEARPSPASPAEAGEPL